MKTYLSAMSLRQAFSLKYSCPTSQSNSDARVLDKDELIFIAVLDKIVLEF